MTSTDTERRTPGVRRTKPAAGRRAAELADRRRTLWIRVAIGAAATLGVAGLVTLGALTGKQAAPAATAPAVGAVSAVRTMPATVRAHGSSMPGMDDEAMANMPGMDQPSTGQQHAATVGMQPTMPGMVHPEPSSSASHPLLGLVLGIFAAVNVGVLIAAAVLRRRDAGEQDRRRQARAAAPASAN